MTLEIRTPRIGELGEHGALHDQGYAFRPGTGVAEVEGQVRDGLLDSMLGAYSEGRLVGRLVVLPFGQFFGGRPIPMGGVSAVVVAPDCRGRGVGRALLDAALVHMRTHGEVISALGPATVGVYRKLGWELAGEQHVRSVPTSDLAGLGRSEMHERPACPDDDDAIKRTYVRVAGTRAGMLARPAFVWTPRLAAGPDRQRFVVEREGSVTGYVSYSCHRRTAGGYHLVVDDFAAPDWDSERALWRHLGGHRAQTDDVTVIGTPLDTLALHLPEPTIRVVHEHHWMLRLVDVAGAIAARGYPSGVSASIPLSVSDPCITANAGTWLLEVEGGRGALTGANARDGAPSITINAFAALFSGATSARTLAAAGLLLGASAEHLATLDAVFAGPTPVMTDQF